MDRRLHLQALGLRISGLPLGEAGWEQGAAPSSRHGWIVLGPSMSRRLQVNCLNIGSVAVAALSPFGLPGEPFSRRRSAGRAEPGTTAGRREINEVITVA